MITLAISITDLPNADPELVAHDLENVIRSHIQDEVPTASVEVKLAPQVDVLHWRDPDSECSLRVFVEDVEVQDFSTEDIDPGRGYERSTWKERIAAASDDASNFGAARLAWLQESADSSHITEDPLCMAGNSLDGFCDLAAEHDGDCHPVPLGTILNEGGTT